jgi:hypothetical protein
MQLDWSLSTLETSGKKMDKARITIALTYNAIGTDRLPIWYIGTTCHPNYFHIEGLSTLDHLGAFWKYNKTT